MYRLFEIESCEIPTDIEGVNLFPSFFKAVVIWAVSNNYSILWG